MILNLLPFMCNSGRSTAKTLHHKHILKHTEPAAPNFSSDRMMTLSQFDGYSPSQSTQTADSGRSPSSNRDTEGTVPVTVKQISDGSHSGEDKANFVVGGVDIKNVSVVGMVANKVERVTDVAFSVDDGTGVIDCKRWTNDSFDKMEVGDIEDGMYVRLHGHLRSFRGKAEISAFSVRPVTNFNEIPYHFIQCIYFHLKIFKLQTIGDASNQSDIGGSLPTTPMPNGTPAQKASLSSQFTASFDIDGLDGIEKKVIAYLQDPSNSERAEGINISELKVKLRLPEDTIMKSIKALEDDGLIYSTIDERHYKSI